MAGMWGAGLCFAQAPAEERRVDLDAINAGQQRISARLRSLDEADAKLKAAELEFRRTQQETKDAAAKLDDARKRNEGAARALKEAQQQSAQARKAYESESEALERLRRPQPAKPAPAKAGSPEKR